MPDGTKIMQMRREDRVAAMKVAAAPPIFMQVNAAAMAAAAMSPAAGSVQAQPAPAQPLIDQVSMQVNVAEVKLFNPALSMTFSQIAAPVEGVVRSSLTCPVSLVETVSDTQFYEAAQDAAKKYYLPTYRLVENETTSGKRFDVRMKKSETGGSIELGLEKFPAMDPAGAEEIGHSFSIMLSFDAMIDGGGRMRKELNFSEYTQAANVIHAVLRVEGLTQLTQLYQALTNDSFQTKLIIRRLFDVAIPIPAPFIPDEDQEKQPKGDQWQNPRKIGDPMWKSAEKMRTVPVFKSQRILIGDEQILRRPAQVKLYRKVSRALDCLVPMVFPPALHGYIFQEIEDTGGAGPSMIKRQVGEHLYYQDVTTPGVFHYLPDSFKMTRRPSPDFSPFMTVSMSGDGSLAETAVTFEYAAVPYTNEARLRAAEESFRVPGQTIQFMPMIGAGELSIALPGASGGSGPFMSRPDALVGLREGITDSITTSLANFQVLYDALLGGSQTVLTGQVTVLVAEDDKILIPFSGRLSDLAGSVCSIKTKYDPAAGLGTVILKNEIESPVSIKAIRISLRDELGLVSFNSQGFDASTLLTLAPKQEITVSIVPLDPLALNKPLEINAELEGVQVHPDREAIWNVILNPNTPIGYERTISVETFDETFLSKPGAEAGQVVKAVVVNFLNGNTVVLRPGALAAQAVVYVSLSSFVLGKTDTRDYKYQLEVVTLAGKRRIGDGQWSTDQSDTLFITPDLIQ